MGMLERHAGRCVRGVPRDRREDLRLEILGHLYDLAADARRRGYEERAARKEARRAFGDSHRIRTDLARAARGKRTVLFTEGIRGWLTSLWIYDRYSFATVLLLVVVIRYGVIGTYHIPTKSMEPTLIGRKPGGDRILVDTLTYWTLRRIPGLRGLATDIERWDILVFENEQAGENFIKRVGGLPGDEMAVSNGDLFIDGEVATKSDEIREAMMIPLVVPGPGEPETLRDDWTRTGGTWTVERRRLVIEAGADDAEQPAILAYPRPLRAWYVDHERKKLGGSMDVLDVRLSVDATWRGGAGGIRLVAGPSDGSVEMFVPGEGSSEPATLVHAGQVVARRPGISLTNGRETRLRVSRVDGVLRGEVDGETILEHRLEWNLAKAQDHEASNCRAELRISRGTAAIRTVRIDRDVHYTREGNLGHGSFTVPEGHYFMLGDNSSNSTDSRRYGPFPEESIIGRPHVVFWPPSRWRLVR